MTNGCCHCCMMTTYRYCYCSTTNGWVYCTNDLVRYPTMSGLGYYTSGCHYCCSILGSKSFRYYMSCLPMSFLRLCPKTLIETKKDVL